MGAVHHFEDATTDLARMQQGITGKWFYNFQHTPERYPERITEILYIALGKITLITPFSASTMFHIARLGAAFLMYTTLYQLAAHIWFRVRTRRIFFFFASIGSGFGFLLFALMGNAESVDFTTPYIFPFYSSLVNVHYPLAIACMATLTAVIINAFRPGVNSIPSGNTGGILILLISLILAWILPSALIPIIASVLIITAIQWWQTRQFPLRESRWLLWLVAPALPILVYNLIFLRSNPFMQVWMSQAPHGDFNPLALLLGLGLPLWIGLPALFRAIRRFEADTDQVMIIWFFTSLIVIYLPLGWSPLALTGFMIPLGFFATRSVEDFWLKRIPRRIWYKVMIPTVLAISFTNLLVMLIPIAITLQNRPTESMLPASYKSVMGWLNEHVTDKDVVLASPEVSLWIPALTAGKVVYGHPVETIQAATKKADVEDWYQSESPDCKGLLNGRNGFGRTYQVKYIIYGPLEKQRGLSSCLADLELLVEIEGVKIFINPIFIR
ncbi:hypothetical protein MASR2M15_00120 [Anaerolineales bacterium]